MINNIVEKLSKKAAFLVLDGFGQNHYYSIFVLHKSDFHECFSK
jgi:hypothetical protein